MQHLSDVMFYRYLVSQVKNMNEYVEEWRAPEPAQPSKLDSCWTSAPFPKRQDI